MMHALSRAVLFCLAIVGLSYSQDRIRNPRLQQVNPLATEPHSILGTSANPTGNGLAPMVALEWADFVALLGVTGQSKCLQASSYGFASGNSAADNATAFANILIASSSLGVREICIGEGTFAMDKVIVTQPVTISGAGKGRTILDATAMTATGTEGLFDIETLAGSIVRFRDLTLIGPTLVSPTGGESSRPSAVEVDNSILGAAEKHTVYLERVEIDQFYLGVSTKTSEVSGVDVFIRDCHFHGQTQAAVTVFAKTDVPHTKRRIFIDRCIIEDNDNAHLVYPGFDVELNLTNSELGGATQYAVHFRTAADSAEARRQVIQNCYFRSDNGTFIITDVVSGSTAFPPVIISGCTFEVANQVISLKAGGVVVGNKFEGIEVGNNFLQMGAGDFTISDNLFASNAGTSSEYWVAAITKSSKGTISNNVFTHSSATIGAKAIVVGTTDYIGRTFTNANVDPTAGPPADAITVTNHGYSTGTKVRLVSTGGLPDPLLPDQDYYIIDFDDDTIQLSTTPAGGPLNITEPLTGSGTHTILESDSATLPKIVVSGNTITHDRTLPGTAVDINGDGVFNIQNNQIRGKSGTTFGLVRIRPWENSHSLARVEGNTFDTTESTAVNQAYWFGGTSPQNSANKVFLRNNKTSGSFSGTYNPTGTIWDQIITRESELADAITGAWPELEIGGRVTITAPRTIAGNVTMVQDGLFVQSGSSTLTFQRGFSAPPLKQVFSGFSPAQVKINVANIERYPDWWGAVADSSTSDVTPIQNAFQSGPDTSSPIRVCFNRGYYIDAPVRTISVAGTPFPVNLRGNARQAGITAMSTFVDPNPIISFPGTPKSITAVATNPTNTLTITAHGFTNNQRVRYLTGSNSTAPGGLVSNTTYFVIFVDANTIQLETSIGAGPVVLTSAGSGTRQIFDKLIGYMLRVGGLTPANGFGITFSEFNINCNNVVPTDPAATHDYIGGIFLQGPLNEQSLFERVKISRFAGTGIYSANGTTMTRFTGMDLGLLNENQTDQTHPSWQGLEAISGWRGMYFSAGKRIGVFNTTLNGRTRGDVANLNVGFEILADVATYNLLHVEDCAEAIRAGQATTVQEVETTYCGTVVEAGATSQASVVVSGASNTKPGTATTATVSLAPAGQSQIHFTSFTFTANDATDVLTTSGPHGMGPTGTFDRFRATSTGTLPTPMVPNQLYYVLTTPTADTLTFSDTPGGSQFDITDPQGGDTHTLFRGRTDFPPGAPISFNTNAQSIVSGRTYFVKDNNYSNITISDNYNSATFVLTETQASTPVLPSLVGATVSIKGLQDVIWDNQRQGFRSQGHVFGSELRRVAFYARDKIIDDAGFTQTPNPILSSSPFTGPHHPSMLFQTSGQTYIVDEGYVDVAAVNSQAVLRSISPGSNQLANEGTAIPPTLLAATNNRNRRVFNFAGNQSLTGTSATHTAYSITLVINPNSITEATNNWAIGAQGSTGAVLQVTGSQISWQDNDGAGLRTLAATGEGVSAGAWQIWSIIHDSSNRTRIRTNGITRVSSVNLEVDGTFDNYRLMSNAAAGTGGLDGQVGALVVLGAADLNRVILVEEYLGQLFGIKTWPQ